MYYKQKKFEQDIQRTYNATIIAPEKLCISSLALVIRFANRILSALYYSILSIVVCMAVPCFPHYLINNTIFGKSYFSAQLF